MKTKKVRNRIYEYLSEGDRTTVEIVEYINATTYYGTTRQQIGNVLSKDPRFEIRGYTPHRGIFNKWYEIKVWGLKGETLEDKL